MRLCEQDSRVFQLAVTRHLCHLNRQQRASMQVL